MDPLAAFDLEKRVGFSNDEVDAFVHKVDLVRHSYLVMDGMMMKEVAHVKNSHVVGHVSSGRA